MLVEKRDNFIKMLKDNGIPTSVIHQRIDKNTIFGKTRGLVSQEYFDNNQINIPIHYGLSNSDIKKIVKTIKKGW